MADKNKNQVPDWLENAVYWASVVLAVGGALRKVMAGEDLQTALDVTAPAGVTHDGTK